MQSRMKHSLNSELYSAFERNRHTRGTVAAHLFGKFYQISLNFMRYTEIMQKFSKLIFVNSNKFHNNYCLGIFSIIKVKLSI